MSYDEYTKDADNQLDHSFTKAETDIEKDRAVAKAQVYATLALAEAINNGFRSLTAAIKDATYLHSGD